jgi:phytoene synthase
VRARQQPQDSALNTDAAHSLQYCADLVRRLDEDRWLSAQYARPEGRDRLIALYALHLEIERAPAMVSEAPLGEIRLQWWREALDEIGTAEVVRAHPAIEAATHAGIIDAEARQAFNAAIDARARLLYDDPFRDVEELENWLRVSEAYVAPLAAHAVGNVSSEARAAIADAAVAFALARHGGLLAPALDRGIRARARDLADASIAGLRSLSAATAPAALHFALTRSYIRAKRAPSPLAKRLRLFAVMATGRF